MPTDENGNYYISADNKSEALQQRGLGVRKEKSPSSHIPGYGERRSQPLSQRTPSYVGNYIPENISTIKN